MSANPNRTLGLIAGGVALVVGGIVLGVTLGKTKKDPPPTPPPNTDIEQVVRSELGKLRAGLEKANKPADTKKLDDLQAALVALAGDVKEGREATKRALDEAKSKGGDSEAVAQLTAKLAEYDQYLAEMQKRLEEFTRTATEAIAKGREVPQPEQPIVPPVVPTPPTEEGGGGGGIGKALGPIIMAACLYYPPACALAAILPDLGLFDKEEHKQALRDAVGNIVAGRPPNPTDLQALAGAIAGKDPNTALRMAGTIRLLTGGAPPAQRQEIDRLIDARINEVLPVPEELANLKKAIDAKKPLAEARKSLKQVGGKPVFSTPATKERARVLCGASAATFATYWEAAGGLKDVPTEVP